MYDERLNDKMNDTKTNVAASAVERLVMPVSDDDFDFYGDWLSGSAIERFVGGYHGRPYSHICCDGDLIEVELIKFKDGSPGVMIGENLGPI